MSDSTYSAVHRPEGFQFPLSEKWKIEELSDDGLLLLWVFGCVWLCLVVFGCVWLCLLLFVFDCFCLCLFVFGCVWLFDFVNHFFLPRPFSRYPTP